MSPAKCGVFCLYGYSLDPFFLSLVIFVQLNFDLWYQVVRGLCQ